MIKQDNTLPTSAQKKIYPRVLTLSAIGASPTRRRSSLALLLVLPWIASACSSASESQGASAADQSTSSTSSQKQSTPTTQPSTTASTGESTGQAPLICKEGELRDCSESPDGTKFEFPGGVAQGNCKKGHQRCENNQWGACQDAVGPQPKDRCDLAGDDANCNAIPNEGCACTDDQAARSCGASEVGACKLGLQTCKGGAWQNCEGEVKPQTERCDQKGIDEDCDGKADLQDEDCECIDEDQELCSLPARGDCSLGKRVCKAGKWGACQPRFAPEAHETCGALREDELGTAVGDEDCDGKIDNHPLGGPAPLGCQFYMIDKDGDGFGALGADYAQDQTQYTYGCFCKGKVPNKDLVPSPDETHNQDCGDCEVGGHLVHPNIVYYEYKPSVCLKANGWSGGAFDYNCSEEEEYEFPTAASCVETDEGTCETKYGHWSDAIPDCGQPGRLATECLSSTPSPTCKLLPSLQVDTQGCR